MVEGGCECERDLQREGQAALFVGEERRDRRRRQESCSAGSQGGGGMGAGESGRRANSHSDADDHAMPRVMMEEPRRPIMRSTTRELNTFTSTFTNTISTYFAHHLHL